MPRSAAPKKKGSAFLPMVVVEKTPLATTRPAHVNTNSVVIPTTNDAASSVVLSKVELVPQATSAKPLVIPPKILDFVTRSLEARSASISVSAPQVRSVKMEHVLPAPMTVNAPLVIAVLRELA